MKTNIKYFTLLVFLIIGIGCYAQSDSTKTQKEKIYSLGLTIAPNYSWRNYFKENTYTAYSELNIENEKPAVGYSLYLNNNFSLKNLKLNAGLGMAIYNYKYFGKFEYPPYTKGTKEYKYTHLFITAPLGCDFLLGTKKKWFTGLNINASYIIKLSRVYESQVYDYYTGDLINKRKQVYDFTKKMFVFWFGVEIGRTIKFGNRLKIDISLIGKYSTNIGTNPILQYPQAIETRPRNLMTTSLTITIYPNFRL